MNVWRNGHAGPTMVLLSGLGTAAPALDFAPLIRQLGAYNVIVVEGFGYGYSDMSARPRTVQNITAELHDALAKLGAPKPYILVGHSIAGFYTLAYAHRYPQEVSAVVGIDPTVPASKAGPGGTSGLPFHAVGAVLSGQRPRPRRLHDLSRPRRARGERLHDRRAGADPRHVDLELRQRGGLRRDQSDRQQRHGAAWRHVSRQPARP